MFSFYKEKKMKKKIDLLIIDPQNSFCDPKGELYVKGAEKDMERLAKMIKRIGSEFRDIHVTLDSHHYVDVAHPVFWKNSKGENPNPFTIISAIDVENGIWTPVFPQLRNRMKDYVKSLETGGRYPLCIWPPHCLIGSWGHNIIPVLYEELLNWEKKPWIVDYVTKGSNIYTEHYSALKAEVPDPEDSFTQLNTKLINTLMEADVIIIAGEAGSHCLANSVRDIAQGFNNDNYIKKIVLLEDGTSPVSGFEHFQTDFIDEMTKKGMIISNTKDFLS
jgi:nicotinamidase-related amidase